MSTWSLSRIHCFDQCALKYKYRYVDKVPEGPKPAAAARGTGIHLEIELFLKGELTELPIYLQYYHQFLADLKELPIEPEVKIALNDKWEPVPFDDPSAWFRGVLDLRVHQGDVVHIYDWKTGKIYDDHSDQREVYALGTMLESPDTKRADCHHVYVDLAKTRAQSFSRADIDPLIEKWGRKANFVLSAVEYPANPSWACRFCSYSRRTGGPCQF